MTESTNTFFSINGKSLIQFTHQKRQRLRAYSAKYCNKAWLALITTLLLACSPGSVTASDVVPQNHELPGVYTEQDGLASIYFPAFSADDAMLKALAGTQNLGYVDLVSSSITDVGVESLRGKDSIVYLALSGPGITDRSMGVIATLKSLRVLILDGTKVSDRSLSELAGLMNLETLVITKSDITDQGAPELYRLPSLRTLSLRGNKITSLAGIGKLRYLRELNINDNPVNGSTLAELRDISTLEKLCIMGTPIRPGDFYVLGKTGLKELQADFSNDTDQWCKALATNVPEIRQLYLGSTSVTSAGLRYLQRCTRLSNLTLSSPHISDNDLALLAKLRTLSSLSLNESPITGKGLRLLSNLLLRTLDISSTQIRQSPDGSYLSRLPKTLLQLRLDNTSLSRRDLKALSELPCLEYLSLMQCTVQSGLEYLALNPRLERLRLQGVSGKNLYEQVLKLPNIKSIELANATISDLDVLKLRHSLAPSSNIQ